MLARVKCKKNTVLSVRIKEEKIRCYLLELKRKKYGVIC